MKFQSPTILLLRRAQLVLMMAAIVPAVVMTLVGIILLVRGSRSVSIVGGGLVVTFCTLSLVGYFLVSIYVGRGVSLAKVQNDFLSLVSHELRTPMTSIRMYIETLQSERVTDPEERRRCLAIVNDEMVRLDGLVGKLIELSKIESGREAFARETVAVADIVDDTLAGFAPVRLAGEVDVEVHLEPELAVRGDRAALGHALLNLLTNAWKYTGQRKRVRIEARALGPKLVELVVSDNGPGVPLDERERIFTPFERGRAARSSTVGGSGLGLAIVGAIVRAHRGEVVLQKAGGEGASFAIRLPRVPG